VLLTGESGTGKELAARTIHELSRRKKYPFLAINCGAISPNLIESELFGHEKGSFTGADRQHQGFFERSHGGTLFLDEITEMPLELQVKLLRVLETGTFARVGSTQTLEADVRVIAASNRPPETAVAAGKLREDLFYRLNVFPISLPPLRDRADDIGLLAEHFLTEVCSTEGVVKRLAREAVVKLERYRWPGNVRELRNVVQRAFVMTPGDVISDEWLPTSGAPATPSTSSSAHEPTPQAATGETITVQVGTSIAQAERQLILATFEHCGHNKERTAAALGISLKTLYNRLKEFANEGREESGRSAASESSSTQ